MNDAVASVYDRCDDPDYLDVAINELFGFVPVLDQLIAAAGEVPEAHPERLAGLDEAKSAITARLAHAIRRRDQLLALPAVCAAFRVGQADLDALRAVLDGVTLYALRLADPGLLVCTVSGARWVVACSSLAGLARFAIRRGDGGPIDYLPTTGYDLIEHLPPGVGLLVDPTEPHAVALPAAWLHPRPEQADPAAPAAASMDSPELTEGDVA